MIDAHCHLDSLLGKVLGLEIQDFIVRAKAAGITRIITCACSYSDWTKHQESQPDLIVPQFGIHPWWAAEPRPLSWLDDLRKLLTTKYPKSGVGEIGLDKNKAKRGDVSFSIQLETFQAQLELAIELDRPCTIHCVNAYGPLVDVLRQTKPTCPIVIHSFSGSGDSVREISREAPSAFFSISGQCPRDDVIQFIPVDQLLIETDSPDQPIPDETALNLKEYLNDCKVPNRYGPKINDPSQLFLVAARVARAVNIPLTEVIRISTVNAIRAFRL
jgi:TatD DNase family protein